MDNETYLTISYFTVGGISILLGILSWYVLRRQFAGAIEVFPNARVKDVLRRIFYWGIFLPAVLGFISVSYKSCSVDTYGKIIEKRSYLIAKNHEQLGAIFEYLVIALFIWAIIAGVGILIGRHRERG